MSKTTFDPTLLPKLLVDLEALAKDFPDVAVVLSDLVALFKKSTTSQSKFVKVGHEGETDPCNCCDCCVQHLVKALACALQCKCCLTADGASYVKPDKV